MFFLFFVCLVEFNNRFRRWKGSRGTLQSNSSPLGVSLFPNSPHVSRLVLKVNPPLVSRGRYLWSQSGQTGWRSLRRHRRRQRPRRHGHDCGGSFERCVLQFSLESRRTIPLQQHTHRRKNCYVLVCSSTAVVVKVAVEPKNLLDERKDE